jgi:hypothetical protein
MEPLRGQLVDSGLVAGIAARAALETPGVLRVEASGHPLSRLLRSGVSRSWRTTAGRAAGRPADPDAPARRHGAVASIREGSAQIELALATDAAFNALEVATQVRASVARALELTGVPAGIVNVTVLAIERTDDLG